MRTFLESTPFLSERDLLRMGGRYEGIVAAVTTERIHNRYKGTDDLKPVIVFQDGVRLVPNGGMLRQLIQHFGPESGDWTGRRIAVIRDEVERMNKKTGEIVFKGIRRIELPEPEDGS